MTRILITIGLILISATQGLSQSKLTQKQIEKRNYQEVIGDKSNSADSDILDKYAMYPDGMKGIQKHILKNLTYPTNAYNKGIKGRVILRFVVEKNGKIKEIEVLKSVDPELDAEAIRVIKKLKVWVPGYKDGKPVRVEYKFPFNFNF
jgi:TonB family protein